MGDPLPPPAPLDGPPLDGTPPASLTKVNPRAWPASIIAVTWLVAGVAAVMVKHRSDNPPVDFFEEHLPWDATPLLLMVLVLAVAVSAVVAAVCWARDL